MAWLSVIKTCSVSRSRGRFLSSGAAPSLLGAVACAVASRPIALVEGRAAQVLPVTAAAQHFTMG